MREIIALIGREREKSGQQSGHGTNDDLPKSKVLFAGTSVPAASFGR